MIRRSFLNKLWVGLGILALIEFAGLVVAYLRPMHTFDLAKTGDAETKVILAEYTLEARNEASSGKIAEIT